MRILYGFCIAALLSTRLTASPVFLSGLGNGQGWNDGHYYTGFVALSMDGIDYRGLCIDALHQASASWDGTLLPLPDGAVAVAMSTYFGVAEPFQFWPSLTADVIGYTMLLGVDNDEQSNNEIQHDVWAQFAPSLFTDTGLLAASGLFGVDMSTFALIVDSNYATGTDLRQAFLVAQSLPPLTLLDPAPLLIQEAPEPSAMLLVGGTLVGLGIATRRSRRRSSRAGI
jgi:hypothetical protein